MGCKQCKISKIDKEINLDDIEKIEIINKENKYEWHNSIYDS